MPLDTKIITHWKQYTAVVLSDAIFSNFTSLRWDHISDDSVTTGVLGNLYLFGEVASEK